MSECRGPGCTHPDCNGDRSDTSTAEDLRSRIDDVLDPIVKYDGNGQPVRASQIGNRAQRRAAAREARSLR